MANPNPDMQNVLDELKAFNSPPIPTLEPRIARELPTPADAAVNALTKSMLTRAMAPPAPKVGSMEHRLIDGPGGKLLLRIYYPEGNPETLPIVVYFHGGGWVIANLNVYDGSCRALTKEGECIVVSVAYRQAPEFKYPAATEDAFAAYQWVVKNAIEIGGDPQRIAVAGESAGGNLATVVCMMAKEQGAPMPVHQLLIYPVTNYAFDTESYIEHADAMPLNLAMMQWFWAHYLETEADGAEPHASPLRATDLSGLPSATVVLAEIDPLRSEGEAYATRLREVGIEVAEHCYQGATHEFFGMASGVGAAKDALAFATDNLKRGFERGRRLAA